MGFLESIDSEQLLTAVGFVVYLIYQNKKLIQRIDSLEAERQSLVDKYIDRANKANADLMEATRMFDSLIRVNK